MFFFNLLEKIIFKNLVFEEILSMVGGGFVNGVEFEVKIILIVIIFCIMVVIGGFMFGYDVGVFGMNILMIVFNEMK